MRRHFHHHPMHHRRFHHRPRLYRRRGNLLGLIGLAALGYTLMERNRHNQPQQPTYVRVENSDDWQN